MSFGDKIIDSVSQKSRDLSEKVSQKYREHVGDELVKKEEVLRKKEADLDLREKEISERERKLKKYYLLPRLYIQAPLMVVFAFGLFSMYDTIRPMFSTSHSGSASPGSASTNGPTPASSQGAASSGGCVSKGISYYKEIGSYPALSTGENAESKVQGMCDRSNGAAF